MSWSSMDEQQARGDMAADDSGILLQRAGTPAAAPPVGAQLLSNKKSDNKQECRIATIRSGARHVDKVVASFNFFG